MRIVVVDCDHDAFEPEWRLAREHGIDFAVSLSADLDELVANARGADGILMQYFPITADVLDAVPGLRAIGRYGVGVDTIDVPAATERGIAVCNVPDYGSEAVSDHAIALALALARGIVRLDRAVRAGSADLAVVRPLHEVGTRTFGVVGLGAIGTMTARKAAGLGYRVLGADPRLPPGGVSATGVTVVGLDELLASADVVSLHVPLTDATRHLVSSRELALMRPGSVLVNTSRGEVVDTVALVHALRSGFIAGAGLDVFESEPLPVSHPLIELDSVILTPHAAWYTEESYERLKHRTLEHVIDVCAGRMPRSILNPEALRLQERTA